MCFSHDEEVFCPKCTATYVKDVPHFVEDKSFWQTGIHLECTGRNYSGCGVDIGYCEKCDRSFQVSYKVDEVTEI